jgi:hypothetical protein
MRANYYCRPFPTTTFSSIRFVQQQQGEALVAYGGDSSFSSGNQKKTHSGFLPPITYTHTRSLTRFRPLWWNKFLLLINLPAAKFIFSRWSHIFVYVRSLKPFLEEARPAAVSSRAVEE